MLAKAEFIGSKRQKNTNILKYYYNLKELFFSASLLQSSVIFLKSFKICCSRNMIIINVKVVLLASYIFVKMSTGFY